MMQRRTFLATATAAASAAGLALTRPAVAQALTPEMVFFDPDAPVLGNPVGDVTIVEFFDYQCPFCKKNHPVLEDVAAADGNVRLVLKDWPIFGAPSVRASQLVLGASEFGGYEPGLEALMATPGRLSDADIDRLLTAAGVDVADADAAYRADRARWDGLLGRNSAQAAALGLQGTPAFVIGSTIYPGLLDRRALEDAIAGARG